MNGNTLGYDYEGWIVSETDGITHAVETYVFDGDGHRVKKYNANGLVRQCLCTYDCVN